MSPAPTPAQPDLLTPVLLDESMLGQFGGVTCGDTPSGQSATEWITGVGWPDVWNELRRGTRVWGYKNVAGQWVGFGSLRQDWWMLDRPPRRQAVHYLPMIGIFAEHQGGPTPAAGADKYCYQLLHHLLDQAVARIGETPFVGLSVRRDNAEAIHVYQKFGFAFVQQRGLNRMLLRLR